MRELGFRLKIRQPEFSPKSIRVWLNDFELTGQTGGLLSLEVKWDPNNLTVGLLKIAVEDLDIDAQTVMNLSAHIKEAV